MLKKNYYSPKRRAMMLKGDDIDHLEVFERDGWMCQLCQKMIDRRLRGQDWMRVTLDHKIPLSKGGTHTYDNCQAAHWLCNIQKGNNLTDDSEISMVVPKAKRKAKPIKRNPR